MNITKNTALLGVIALILGVGLFQTHSIKVDLDLSEQNNNTITVTGRAEMQVVPDTASISFYVTKKSAQQDVAANYVNKKTKDIVTMLGEISVPKKDIKTTNYSLNPEYNWNDGTRTFNGYRAQQNVTVIVRDLEQLSEVLAKVVEQDVDSLNGPNLYVDDLDDVKDSLRAEAIVDAKEKANKLAKELGVSVEKIVGFSEGNDGGGYAPMMKMDMAESAVRGSAVIEPEISIGEEEIVKTVTITFKIEN